MLESRFFFSLPKLVIKEHMSITVSVINVRTWLTLQVHFYINHIPENKSPKLKQINNFSFRFFVLSSSVLQAVAPNTPFSVSVVNVSVAAYTDHFLLQYTASLP